VDHLEEKVGKAAEIEELQVGLVIARVSDTLVLGSEEHFV